MEKSENNSIVKKQYKAYKRTKKHLSECSFQRDVPFVLYSMKIKEQTKKLAADCSKHCFEVVDKTDEVSSKHCFEVGDRESGQKLNLKRK